MKQLSVYLVVIAFGLLAACKKESKSASVSGAPTNLTLTASVNPDNSGNVSFTASATNAVNYEFDFGNGIFQNAPQGSVTYKYPAAGTYTVNVVAKSSGGQTVSKSVQVTVTIGSSSPVVWSEEFNTSGAPDASKWGYDLGGGGWGNNELQHYTNRPENITVSNGTLKIFTKKETFSGSAYTSARILTKDKFSFKYGKVEVRAKLPSGGGIWPAIWMLGSNISTTPWPACGEIDIMEHVGNQPNKIFGTLHYPGRSGGNADGASVIIPNVTTEFHRYGLEWSATAIKISVDDVVFYTYANNASSPFHQNFFIILNTAMGGNFGGAVDPAFTNGTFEIDYVRVYN